MLSHHVLHHGPRKIVAISHLRTGEGIPDEIRKIRVNPEAIPLPLLSPGKEALQPQAAEGAIDAGHPMRGGVEIDVFHLEQCPQHRIENLAAYSAPWRQTAHIGDKCAEFRTSGFQISL